MHITNFPAMSGVPFLTEKLPRSARAGRTGGTGRSGLEKFFSGNRAGRAGPSSYRAGLRGPVKNYNSSDLHIMAPWKSRVVDSGPIRSAWKAEWHPLVHGGLCLSVNGLLYTSMPFSLLIAARWGITSKWQ